MESNLCENWENVRNERLISTHFCFHFNVPASFLLYNHTRPQIERTHIEKIIFGVSATVRQCRWEMVKGTDGGFLLNVERSSQTRRNFFSPYMLDVSHPAKTGG